MQEVREFFVIFSGEALGDIAHRRDGSTTDLIRESKVLL
jgi:hypothetical protein